MRHKPKSLEEIGLENYLDQTADIHNDFKYSDFKRMYDANLNSTNIARAFTVDRRTINKWITVYEKELAND